MNNKTAIPPNEGRVSSQRREATPANVRSPSSRSSASSQNRGASVPSAPPPVNPSPPNSRRGHSRGIPPHSSTAVANHHSEQRVYNKTADPPRQDVHNARDRREVPASSLQTAPAGECNGIHNTNDGTVPFHTFSHHATHQYDFWMPESRDIEDPTSVRIDERFQFDTRSEMGLPTPENSHPTPHVPLPLHSEPVYAPHLQTSRTVRTRSR